MFVPRLVPSLIVAALASLGIAPSAHGDDDYESDQTFSRGLAEYGLLSEFGLKKHQGQRYCKSLIDGESNVDAISDLMRYGDYSLDAATAIASSAMVAYCMCAFNVAVGIPPIPSLCRPFELGYRRQGG